MLDQLFRDMADAAQDAARQPEFAAVRRRGRRVRARRRVGVAAVALLAVSGLASVAFLGTGKATPDSIATSPTVPAEAPRAAGLGSADGEHVYLAVQNCVTCPETLYASTDGGRTWQLRGDLMGLSSATITVVAPEVLFAYRPGSPTAASSSSPSALGEIFNRPSAVPVVSVDGGRAWTDVQVAGDPAATLPAGTRAVDCDIVPGAEPCTVYAVDPATGTLRALATQPPLDRVDLVETPATAGIWVRGTDPGTGRPASAVSHDGGASWTTAVFDAEPVAPEAGRGGVPELATTNGTLAFAMFIDDRPLRVYRSTDGGRTWTRTNDGVELPDRLSGPYSMVTPDGTHVVTADDNGRFQYLASSDGRAYTRVDLPGLPALGHSPRAVTPNRFIFMGTDGLYTSPDGRAWTRRPLP